MLPLLIISLIRKLFGRIANRPSPQKSNLAPTELKSSVRVYARSEHNISRSVISENSLKVLYRLHKAGYKAYLVGGCVRDLLLGREPKDFDVVTDAHPEEIRNVFRNSRLIGRRFRLAHVFFGSEIVEVATFRASNESNSQGERVTENGRILRDNVYGTIEEDVWRRDFTVNALYYNIADFSLVDFVGGVEDHKAGILRLIGPPEERYREDPVRMLRAIRFSVKLGFTIDASCQEPIHRLGDLLETIPASRLYEEVVKLMMTGYAAQSFEQLRHFGIFKSLFPETENCLSREPDGFPLIFLAKALENTDTRFQAGKAISPYFLFAALLWEPVRLLASERIKEGENEAFAFQEASSEVLSRQIRRISIPRTISLPVREVWSLQPRFERTKGGRPFRLLSHPRFRAAYDFFLLRAETGEADPELAQWWQHFQAAGENEQRTMTRESGARRRTGRSKKRRARPADTVSPN